MPVHFPGTQDFSALLITCNKASWSASVLWAGGAGEKGRSVEIPFFPHLSQQLVLWEGWGQLLKATNRQQLFGHMLDGIHRVKFCHHPKLLPMEAPGPRAAPTSLPAALLLWGAGKRQQHPQGSYLCSFQDFVWKAKARKSSDGSGSPSEGVPKRSRGAESCHSITFLLCTH